MEKTVTMSFKELERLKILYQVIEGKMSQVVASKKLGISDRQVRRLLNQMKIEGDKGLISKKRGNTSNHCLSSQTKEEALRLVSCHYTDFGPKLTMNIYLRITGLRFL